MPLPKPIAPQTLAGLKSRFPSSQDIYETAKATIDSQNQIIQHLSPGDDLSGSSFTFPAWISVAAVSGSIKRGRFMAIIGTQIGTPSTIRIAFPSGTFKNAPFAQVVRNGGDGVSNFSYSETASGISITIDSPKTGEKYGFQFSIQE